MKYINIKQHDITDCGPACVAIIARYYKSNVSIAQLRETMETNTAGTCVKGIVLGATEIGFKAKALKTIDFSEDHMGELPLPCIAHVNVDGELSHYVVILEIKKDTIIISDPAEGIIKVSRESFRKQEICRVRNRQYKWSGVLITLSPTSELEKKMHKFSRSSFLLNLISPNRRICGVIIGISLLYTVINISTAFYYKILLDKILPRYTVQRLLLVVMAFFLLILIRTMLNIVRINLTLVFGKQIHQEISMNYCKHLLNLQQKFFDNRRVGELATRFQDASFVQELLYKIVLTVFMDVLTVIGAGILLFKQNRVIFGGILVISILYVTLAALFKNKYEIYSKNQLANEALTMSGIFDFLKGIMTIKTYNANKYAFKTIQDRFNTYLESAYRLDHLENLQYGLKSLVGSTGEIAIFAFGLATVFIEKMTLGELMTLSALITYFLDPIRNLLDLQGELHTAFVATERIQEIMELSSEELTEKQELLEGDTFTGNIIFKNIAFGYNLENDVLRNLSLKIEGGAKVAIIGKSGSGKSTITKLLMKFYALNSGSISIGEVDIKRIHLSCVRANISYVSQETYLFNVSIMDNLCFGNKEISDDIVYTVCKIVQLHDFIMSMPLQYSTKLEEGGNNLSSGQQQRFMLARALLKNPRVLIMDEATSNLDYDLEKNICDKIRAYLPKTTIIMITHRANVVKDCDMIYVLEKGKLREQGTHETLLEESELYQKLLGS